MHISVLQWNVWFKENIEHVYKFLENQEADVICLQELTRGYMEQSQENTWEYLAHHLGFAYCAQEIPIITETTQWSQANAIFSRFPIVHKHQVWVHEPDDPESRTDQYRGYLEAELQVGPQILTVATTHMSFTQPADDDHETENLLRLAQAHPKNYVLTGDLNAIPASQRVQKLLKHFSHAGPDLSQNTWTTKPFNFPDFDATSLDWRYDYIFTSPDIAVQNARILETATSDHLPVLATIDLPNEQSR